MYKMISYLLHFIIALFCISQVNAADHIVSNGTDFQNALTIAASNSGDDTIVLKPSVYVGGFKYVSTEAFSLKITSSDNINIKKVILEGGLLGSALLVDASSANANIFIENITVQKAKDGIHCLTKGRVTINRCLCTGIINNNFSIKISSENSEIRNCIFINNNGGLAFYQSANALITNCSFINNQNSIWTDSDIYNKFEIEKNIFSNNETTIIRGKYLYFRNNIYNKNNYADMSGGDSNIITNNNIKNNNSKTKDYILRITCNEQINFSDNNLISNSGNILYFRTDGGDIKILNNFFLNNINSTSSLLYVYGKNDISIQNNIISDNQFGSKGIYIHTSIQLLNIVNNTIFGNTASSIGGSLCIINSNCEGVINIYNNIIYGNEAAESGGDIYIDGYGAQLNAFNNNYHDIHYNGWNSEGNNIDAEPLFFDAANGDYTLKPNSPCIDTGNNNAPELPTTDNYGDLRIYNDIVDMGAYEHSTIAMHPADTNQDYTITQSEFNSYNQAWRNNTDWQTSQKTIAADFLTRAGYILQKGGRYHNTGARKPLCWEPTE